MKNLAQERLESGINPEYWQEAHDWITEIDSVTTIEHIRQWNRYSDAAFSPAERNTTPGMIFRVMFSRPYNPFTYLRNKDNDLVDDLLWESGKDLTAFERLVKITAPVLLLTGRYDDIGLPEENQRAHELIPNSSIHILPDAGHESYLDQPELFNQQITQYISEH